MRVRGWWLAIICLLFLALLGSAGVVYLLLEYREPEPVSPVMAETAEDTSLGITVILPVKDTIALSPLLVRGTVTTGDDTLHLVLEQASGVLVDSEVSVSGSSFQAVLELHEYTSGPALLTIASVMDSSVQVLVPLRLSATQ